MHSVSDFNAPVLYLGHNDRLTFKLFIIFRVCVDKRLYVCSRWMKKIYEGYIHVCMYE
jgi:hypothetical protein